MKFYTAKNRKCTIYPFCEENDFIDRFVMVDRGGQKVDKGGHLGFYVILGTNSTEFLNTTASNSEKLRAIASTVTIGNLNDTI